MNCPACGAASFVKDSRRGSIGTRRRRICEACNRRFTTYEIIVPNEDAIVIRHGKHSGSGVHTLMALRKVAPDIELFRIVHVDDHAPCFFCFNVNPDGLCPICNQGEP